MLLWFLSTDYNGLNWTLNQDRPAEKSFGNHKNFKKLAQISNVFTIFTNYMFLASFTSWEIRKLNWGRGTINYFPPSLHLIKPLF